MCKVSFIVPVYRAKDTLLRVVESLSYGDEQDCEIILVEDCSGDDSFEECKRLAAQFPKVVCVQNDCNRGVSYTRNHGLKIAQGEYIMFVDSDDWVVADYANVMIKTAQAYPEALPICGFAFRDLVNGVRADYVWGTDEPVSIVRQEHFFELVDKVMIQCVWNKVFRKEVIERAGLRFDETQSMGEDFQFALDYMQATNCHQCVVVNRPLYIYIRANQNSLMSNFGLVETENETNRLKTLATLCGEDTPLVKEAYEKRVQMLKDNYVYQAMHSKKLSKADKLAFIETVKQDGKAKAHYREHAINMFKESLARLPSMCQKTFGRIEGRLQRAKNSRLIKKARRLWQGNSVSVISQNCIGAVFLHDMGMQFCSPTVDLFFDGMDFVKFVLNLEHYLAMEPRMQWDRDYPIGQLDDITIHFMHYTSCEQALAAWKRRCARVNMDRLLVVCTDMEGFTPEVYEEWKSIPYKKVLFTANEAYAQGKDSVYYPQYREQGKVPNLIDTREFYQGNALVHAANEV